MKNISGIEVARGVAAIMVVFYHLAHFFEANFGYLPVGNVTEIGRSGVDFFFVLSGFIIFYIHAKDIGQPSSIRPYLIKRAVRVYPIFLVMLMVQLSLTPFVSSLSFPDIFEILKQATLLPLGESNLILGVSWTLHYEITFYLMFVTLLFNKRIGLLVSVLWLISVIVNNYIVSERWSEHLLLSSSNIQFFMGAFVGYVLNKVGGRWHSLFTASGFLYLVGIWGLEIVDDAYLTLAVENIHYGIAFSLIVLGISLSEKNKGITFPSLLLTLGKASYSIYLCHLFFLGIYFKLFKVLGFAQWCNEVLLFFVIIVMILCSSVLFSKWVEYPLNARIRKWAFNRC